MLTYRSGTGTRTWDKRLSSPGRRSFGEFEGMWPKNSSHAVQMIFDQLFKISLARDSTYDRSSRVRVPVPTQLIFTTDNSWGFYEFQ